SLGTSPRLVRCADFATPSTMEGASASERSFGAHRTPPPGLSAARTTPRLSLPVFIDEHGLVGEARLLLLQSVLRVLADELGHDAGPSGLVARTEAGARVAMEIFVERDEVAPVRIGLELLPIAVDGPPPVRVEGEEADQPVGEIGRDLPE